MKNFFKKLTVVLLFALVNNISIAFAANPEIEKSTIKENYMYSGLQESTGVDPGTVLRIAMNYQTKLPADSITKNMDADVAESIVSEDICNISFIEYVIDWLKDFLGL